MTRAPGCTLIFFGIDRRLDITGPIIEKLIVQPAKARFPVTSVGFLWAPKEIVNSRSGESAPLPPPRINQLPEGRYSCPPPLDLSQDTAFTQLKSFGDFWKDGFSSLANLYSQLLSLKFASKMALENAPDITIFLRPDLLYHDNFSKVLDRAASMKKPQVFLPHWQPHGGLNDRFAVCVGRAATFAYGQRLAHALDYCQTNKAPLHSERLVQFALSKECVSVQRVGIRASRVRANGQIRKEDFSFYGWKPALRQCAGRVRRTFTSSLAE